MYAASITTATTTGTISRYVNDVAASTGKSALNESADSRARHDAECDAHDRGDAFPDAEPFAAPKQATHPPPSGCRSRAFGG